MPRTSNHRDREQILSEVKVVSRDWSSRGMGNYCLMGSVLLG